MSHFGSGGFMKLHNSLFLPIVKIIRVKNVFLSKEKIFW